MPAGLDLLVHEVREVARRIAPEIDHVAGHAADRALTPALHALADALAAGERDETWQLFEAATLRLTLTRRLPRANERRLDDVAFLLASVRAHLERDRGGRTRVLQGRVGRWA